MNSFQLCSINKIFGFSRKRVFKVFFFSGLSGTAETVKLIEIFNALIIYLPKSFPIVDGNNII